jgi:hypothetical protein
LNKEEIAAILFASPEGSLTCSTENSS